MHPMTFPKPDRSKHPPNKTKTADTPEIDIGWNEGFMSDGCPYRAECWAQDQITMLTFFFSTNGKEHWNDERIAELLVAEGLLNFLSDEKFVRAMPMTDDAGNDMWSVNIVVGDDDNTFANGPVGLRAYG